MQRGAMTPRQQAKANGEKYYISGRPCCLGHTSKRLVSNKTCVACADARVAGAGGRVGYISKSSGASRSLVYAYSNMRGRCLIKTHPKYPHYGGRGITVCERWLGKGGFKRFVEDMGERPSPLHSLDRIRVNEGYHPGNCRWATTGIQARNRRRIGNLENFTFEEIARHLRSWPQEKRDALIESITQETTT